MGLFADPVQRVSFCEHDNFEIFNGFTHRNTESLIEKFWHPFLQFNIESRKHLCASHHQIDISNIWPTITLSTKSM